MINESLRSRLLIAAAALILAVILLGFGAVTFALWVGGHDVVAGRMTGGELSAFEHEGFWQPMDTFKDKITYDRMEGRGDCPWKVWQR